MSWGLKKKYNAQYEESHQHGSGPASFELFLRDFFISFSVEHENTFLAK